MGASRGGGGGRGKMTERVKFQGGGGGKVGDGRGDTRAQRSAKWARCVYCVRNQVRVEPKGAGGRIGRGKKYKTKRKRKDPWTPFNEKHQTALLLCWALFSLFLAGIDTHTRANK